MSDRADLAAAFAPLADETNHTATVPRGEHGSDEVLEPMLPFELPPVEEIKHSMYGRASARWVYCSSTGEPCRAVVRFDPPDGKVVLPHTFGRRIWIDHTGNRRDETGWRFKAPEGPLSLYNLDQLTTRASAPVIIVEGEKAADGAARRFPDCVAVTSQGGAKAASKSDWSPLAGRDVVIWPDHDVPGRGYARDVTSLCLRAGAHRVGTVAVPEHLPERWDLADALPEGMDEAFLRRLLDNARLPAAYDAAADRKISKLLVEAHNPDETADRLRDVLARTGRLFDRGSPVRMISDKATGGMVAQPLTVDLVVREAHRVSRPVRLKQKGTEIEEVECRLPDAVARMYLAMRGEWQLPPLNGISSAPLLRDDGRIHTTEGYDAETGLWCENVPDISALVPERPTREQAEAALREIRTVFQTFPFADAEMVERPGVPVPAVDLARAPGQDESAFLIGLLTAVCRPSLWLAPALCITSPSMSGAGAGKGLLARCLCVISSGRLPSAVTGGGKLEEFEKRLGAELMGGAAAVFLDNLNGQALRSEALASAITERPSRTRILGTSEMVTLNATALIILTGNGLSVTEDLARRFLRIELDPCVEHAETRKFEGDLLETVAEKRPALLSVALTIWRWGRTTAESLDGGRPLGSFGQWCRWVRDPLLALGCKDPVERVLEAKENDLGRQSVAELFTTWYDHHHDVPIKASDLHEEVRNLIDPAGRGRQYVAAELKKLVGTRIAGFTLTSRKGEGRWSPTTYAVKRV